MFKLSLRLRCHSESPLDDEESPAYREGILRFAQHDIILVPY